MNTFHASDQDVCVSTAGYFMVLYWRRVGEMRVLNAHLVCVWGTPGHEYVSQCSIILERWEECECSHQAMCVCVCSVWIPRVAISWFDNGIIRILLLLFALSWLKGPLKVGLIYLMWREEFVKRKLCCKVWVLRRLATSLAGSLLFYILSPCSLMAWRNTCLVS